MKKYNAPELKVLAFNAEEAIAAAAPKGSGELNASNYYNDAEFDW